jgi:hypothetical protein
LPLVIAIVSPAFTFVRAIFRRLSFFPARRSRSVVLQRRRYSLIHSGPQHRTKHKLNRTRQVPNRNTPFRLPAHDSYNCSPKADCPEPLPRQPLNCPPSVQNDFPVNGQLMARSLNDKQSPERKRTLETRK